MYYRFGKCEPYKGDLGICDNIFTVEVDYVFVSRLHGTQEYIKGVKTLLNVEGCRDGSTKK